MMARDHHYLFSHVHLRNQALRHPEQVVSELSGPMAEAFLMFLWQQVGDVAESAVSPAGLSVAGVDAIAGGTLALVRMPAPERDTETMFAAIFLGPAGARYFVFDRSVGDASAGTLAELELDETRVNLGRHPATQDALLDVLRSELSTRAQSSIPPARVAPTVAMPSFPPPAGAPSLAPGAAARMPGVGAPKKKSILLPAIGLALGTPLMCCLGTSILAYDSGLDESATFEVQSEVVIDREDREQLQIRLEGPEDVWSYRVEGPGAESCSYLYRYGAAPVTCTIDLGAVADATPSYRIVASGNGPRFFGESLDGTVELERTIEVTRELGLRFSESRQATIVRGFPGRLEVNRDGFLRLVDAPAGASLTVGAVTSSEPTPMVALDLVALTNQVGVAAVLRDGGRVSIAGVSVRLPDGTTASGAAQIVATELAPALATRLADLGDANLGAATGTATVWLADGRLREMNGSASTIADVGRVIVSSSEEVPSGRCGPYSLWGIGYGSTIPRMRWRTEVVAYDRVADERIARRSFNGERPSCPYSISQDTTRISGALDTTEADEWARQYLAPEEAQ